MMRSLPRSASLFAGLMMGTMLAGCGSTTLVKDFEQTQVGTLSEGESVVVLSDYKTAALETDPDFIDCVHESLGDDDAGLRVIPQREFIDGMYPFFEASTAPANVNAISRLTHDPTARERMAEMNVRYIVWVGGDTQTVDKSGSFSCTIGPGGGGCFGWASWTDRGTYNAKIWDIKNGVETGTFNVDSTGTSHLVGVVLPVPLLARVESEACEAMAQRVSLAVDGGEAPSLLRQAQSQEDAASSTASSQ